MKINYTYQYMIRLHLLLCLRYLQKIMKQNTCIN
nr:MAG TPA: hypothetical protein [Caudoviricetes sp.]